MESHISCDVLLELKGMKFLQAENLFWFEQKTAFLCQETQIEKIFLFVLP